VFSIQSRPLTRYLPVRDAHLNLEQFVASAGHNADACSQVIITATACRGFLAKIGGRLHTWKRRWFVFDRAARYLCYYADRTEMKPPRGLVYFQAVEDVFVDHMGRARSPTPQLTFCVKTNNRAIYLVAPSAEAMRIWVDVIFTGAEGYREFAWRLLLLCLWFSFVSIVVGWKNMGRGRQLLFLDRQLKMLDRRLKVPIAFIWSLNLLRMGDFKPLTLFLEEHF